YRREKKKRGQPITAACRQTPLVARRQAAERCTPHSEKQHQGGDVHGSSGLPFQPPLQHLLPLPSLRRSCLTRCPVHQKPWSSSCSCSIAGYGDGLTGVGLVAWAMVSAAAALAIAPLGIWNVSELVQVWNVAL